MVRSVHDRQLGAVPLTAAQRGALTDALLACRYGVARRPPPLRLRAHPDRNAVTGALRELTRLTSPEFVRVALLPFVAVYRIHRFAQSRQNLVQFRVTTDTMRRQITRLANAWDRGDEASAQVLLAGSTHQTKHFIAVSLRSFGRHLGTHYEGAFDGLTSQQLGSAAREALNHPLLGKQSRGRRRDRAGDALIWGARRAFTLMIGASPRAWADGRSASRFLQVVSLLFQIAGDARSEATLRDRCRSALKPTPAPPFEGVLFGRRARVEISPPPSS